MNFSTFHVSLVKPIGWRPTFKVKNEHRPRIIYLVTQHRLFISITAHG